MVDFPVLMSLLLSSLQESILSHVQRIVKGEVSLAMKEQQAVVTSSIMQAMRSAAGTPVPTAHLDYQTQQANILQLLQQGQLNQAFQQVARSHTHMYNQMQHVAVSPGDSFIKFIINAHSKHPHKAIYLLTHTHTQYGPDSHYA